LRNLKNPIVVPEDACFTGFDAYKQLLAVPEVNYVILAEPPHFRPRHMMAAIQAGKHVFAEKPAAVDGPGAQLVIEAGELAKQKGLGIAVGTQRRHQRSYNETIKRLQDGMIGDIVEARSYWNGGAIWVIDREPGWSDMEWQLRNWNYFTWLGGDHIVEQHVHNLDIINWVLGEHPVRAIALGGRQARGGKEHGHIYDHFAVEFEYPNGVRVASYCRQTNGCAERIEERIVGTKGVAFGYGEIKGEKPWKFEGEDPNPYVLEHADLVASIRSGKLLNEGRQIAESTMCAIVGRMSAYTGRAISWDWAMNASKLDLSPAKYEFGPNPVDPVAVPGKTPLI